jgi:hypothetical protein
MATTRSDIQSLVSQPAPPMLPPKRENYIERRWREWLPYCTVEARRHSDPANHLYLFRTRHRSRLINILLAGIQWDVLREHGLDDPTIDDARFNFLLRAAIERRRCRMKTPTTKSKKYPAQGGRS